MAYIKKTISRVERLAGIRLNALKNFDNAGGGVVNYGSKTKSLSSADYEMQIEKCKLKRDQINTSLETADGTTNDLKSELRKLSNMNTEILSGIRGKYGVDSNEYEQAGGVRQSERKKRTMKSKISK